MPTDEHFMTLDQHRRISVDESARRSNARCVLSFDVEEWFHAGNLRVPPGHWAEMPSRIERSMDTILSLLQEYDTKATFFVLGWIAQRHPSLVRRIRRGGHEIASHGFWHQPLHYMTLKTFVEDVHRSQVAIESAADTTPIGFRAPSYSIDERTSWAFDGLQELGFRYDSSVYPACSPHRRYGWRNSPLRPHRVRTDLWEFPLPTLSLLGRRMPAATGAYLRIAPCIVTTMAIEQNLNRGIPVVVNIHPWELDPDQPRAPTSLGRRLLHYTNLRTTRNKLDHLLRRYNFVTIRQMLHAIDTDGIIAQGLMPKTQVLGQSAEPAQSKTGELREWSSTDAADEHSLNRPLPPR